MINAWIVATLGHVWSDVVPAPVAYRFGHDACGARPAVNRALDHLAAVASINAVERGGGIVFQATNCSACNVRGRVVETGGCRSHRDVLHEVFHGLGFEHEQLHPDAGRYMAVDPGRLPAAWAAQWAPKPNLTAARFDMCSVMMYNPRDPLWNGAVSLTAEGEAAAAACPAAALSAADAAALRRRYGRPRAPAPVYGSLLLAALAAPCTASMAAATSSTQTGPATAP